MTLQIATFNIWNRSGDWDARLAVLRRELSQIRPDILGLQEVVQVEYDGTKFDQGEIIGEGLGYHVFYGRHPDNPYPWGNSILSRHPFTRTKTLNLPDGGTDERRALVLASIATPRGEIAVGCTHLNWKLDEGHIREEQIVFVVEELLAFADGTTLPPVLIGDLNADPDSDEIRYLRGLTTLKGGRTYFSDAFHLAGPPGDSGATYARSNPYAAPLREPDRRIDYIFSRGPDTEGRGEPLRARRIFTEPQNEVFASDHYGVLAELS